MDFDNTEITDPRAVKWLDDRIEFIKFCIKDKIEFGDEPRCKMEDVKPGMPYNTDDESEDFNTFYVFKDVARDNDLLCFRYYADKDMEDVEPWPKTLKGYAAVIEYLLRKYDERLQEIAGLEPMDAVRKTWLFVEPEVAEMLEDNGEDPWRWTVEAIKEDTHFDRVGKTEGSPEMQQEIDSELEDGSLKDALMDMHGPQDNTLKVKQNMMEVLEKSLDKELVPGLAKAGENKGVKLWLKLYNERNSKLEAMQTFGDMAETFKEMRK